MLTEIPSLQGRDGTTHAIRTGFSLRKQSGEVLITRLDELASTQNPKLMDQNVAFGATSGRRLLAIPHHVLNCEF
jgi:hypothetical protein